MDKIRRCAICGKKLGRLTWSKDDATFCSQRCIREYEDRQAGRSSRCAICNRKATGWLRFVKDGLTFCCHGCLREYRAQKEEKEYKTIKKEER